MKINFDIPDIIADRNEKNILLQYVCVTAML